MKLISLYRSFVANHPWLGGLAFLCLLGLITWSGGLIPLGDGVLEKIGRVVMYVTIGSSFSLLFFATAHGLMDSNKKKR